LLDDAQTLAVVAKAFARVNGLLGWVYLQVPECSNAVAAAEVVAALRGRAAAGLPNEVTGYVQRIGAPPPPKLVAAALRALGRIRARSELRSLWAESSSRNDWQQGILELKSRLT
jgi:hypothetical protein